MGDGRWERGDGRSGDAMQDAGCGMQDRGTEIEDGRSGGSDAAVRERMTLGEKDF
jgi:hypothetical protein